MPTSKSNRSFLFFLGIFFPIFLLLIGFWLPIGIWLSKYIGDVNPFEAINEASFSKLFFNTLLISGLTTISSVIIAYPVAFLWWVSKKQFRFFLTTVIFLPVIVGLLARNYSWIGLFSGKDILSSLGLSLIGAEVYLYTMKSIIIVMTYIFIPIAFFILIYAFSSVVDYEIEAARTLGASFYEILRKIILPCTYRQAVIGGLLIFANALGYFVTPRMLGGGNYDMTGNLIWRYTDLGHFADASSVSISFLLLLIPFFTLSFLLIIQSRKKILGR